MSENFIEFQEQTKRTKQEHYLWTEKHRPEDMSEFVGNESLKESLNRYIKDGDIANILLTGPPGTGKTSAAKILVNKINCDYMYINASSENGIETIRQKIIGFTTNAGFKDLKVAILDECLCEDTIVYVLRNGVEMGIPIKKLDENNYRSQF